MPFFPLSVFLVPGEDLPLRIFEPRYLQLIEEAKESGFTFVIPYVLDDRMTSYGCEVKLQQEISMPQIIVTDHGGRDVVGHVREDIKRPPTVNDNGQRRACAIDLCERLDRGGPRG